jgi:hypothetical protein
MHACMHSSFPYAFKTRLKRLLASASRLPDIRGVTVKQHEAQAAAGQKAQGATVQYNTWSVALCFGLESNEHATGDAVN